MSLETKSVSEVILSDKQLELIKHTELYKSLRKEVLKEYRKLEDEFFSQPWIAFTANGEKGYWNSQTKLAVPVLPNYDDTHSSYFGYKSYPLTKNEVLALFGTDSGCPDEIMKGIKVSDRSGYHYIAYNGGHFRFTNNFSSNYNSDSAIRVYPAKINKSTFISEIRSGEFKAANNYTMYQAVSLLRNRPIAELSENDIDSLVGLLYIDKESIINKVNDSIKENFVIGGDIEDAFIKILLECDSVRADLEKYDEKCLSDVNSGHWELWQDENQPVPDEAVRAKLEFSLRARNPKSDIHENGLIGIDFGTKSTIVSVQDGDEHSTLLRIGIGRLNKAPKAHHYENPTIMEFINIQKFYEDYYSRLGRPLTSIDDVRVSHAAANDLKSCGNNSYFDAFFYDIKQWCGDKRRSVKLIDQQPNYSEIELPPFESLSNKDFNPLELYAYYLGLYINNMRSGIYLDYVLSYPVTYNLEVKTKILESFKQGIWISLPETLQRDEDVRSKFRVRMGVSEPEAYAITALKGYGFFPEDENEMYLYAIFDFGGGTTDFDFGIWRGANYSVREEEDRDYVIEHLNSEGDKYLGGENLLELLAFEIFKANNDFMRMGKQSQAENSKAEIVGFSFTLPPECKMPSGCEMTINNSPSAKRNTKQLMEVLRPFWEGIIGFNEQNAAVKETKSNSNATKNYNGYIFRNDEKMKFPISDDGAVTVDLFDNNGAQQSGQKLYIQKKDTFFVDMIGILEDRIERGVRNFFNSIKLVLESDTVKNSSVDEIQIFLAGNSSKSPILKKLFNKYIDEENQKINKEKSDISHFNLFPSLGTEEAVELQEKLGVEINKDITAPTGKTGVAYGLIDGRDGGPIRVISNISSNSQSKFMFNIGKVRKRKFTLVLDRNEAVYGQWVRFGAATSNDFEIYYTSLPSPKGMPVTDPGIHKIRCRVPEIGENSDIYIRSVKDATEDIEYAVTPADKAPDDTTKVFRTNLPV